MREYLEKFKTQIPDTAELFALLGTIAACLKVVYDILNGTMSIVAFGYNNKLLSVSLIIGFLFTAIFIKRFLSVLINLLINKLFKKDSPNTIEDAKKNETVGQIASTASSYVNLTASILTLFGVSRTLLKGADKNTAIVQDVGGYLQYVQKFSMEDKKEWFDNIINTSGFEMDKSFWAYLEKDMPWNLINNQLDLLTYIQQKMETFREDKIIALANKAKELKIQLDHANKITTKILAVIESIIKTSWSIIYNHPYLSFTFLLTLSGLIWFLMMHKTDLISEGFRRTGEMVSRITEYTEEIKNSFNERIDLLYKHHVDLKTSVKALGEYLGILSQEIVKLFIKQNNTITVLQNDVTLLKIEVEQLKKINEALTEMIIKQSEKMSEITIAVIETATNNL